MIIAEYEYSENGISSREPSSDAAGFVFFAGKLHFGGQVC
jgi:hypothetical protein